MRGMHKRVSKRATVIASAIALGSLVIAGGVAYALWSVTGSGSGRATAGVVVEATITPADGEPDLYPGVTDGDLYFTVDNPNPFAVTFTDMTVGAITSSDEAGCPGTNITVTSPVTGLNLVAPAGTSGELTVADVVAMDAGAPNECQGVTFDVAVTLSGVQD